jgi:hypothetical protein
MIEYGVGKAYFIPGIYLFGGYAKKARTVTCFLSPSRALREVRIFSAKWGGVWETGSRSGSIVGVGVDSGVDENGIGIEDASVSPVQRSPLPSSSITG